MGWLQDNGWLVGISVAAALALALTGLAWWSARRLQPASVPGAAAQRRVDLAFIAAVVITLAGGAAAVSWLFGRAADVQDPKDKATVQADAIRTGATLALGTGGAAFLLLAYRRQRQEEVDTRERRITELYTKAVEQLGHEKAPVRVGALYSLERLAQANPEHRQPAVDVLCAYLRMPFTPPARPGLAAKSVAAPATDRDPASPSVPGPDSAREEPPPQAPLTKEEQDKLEKEELEKLEELEVRQTAQRLLADHLRRPQRTSGTAAQRLRPSPRQAFWPGISLDLTGAALVELHLTEASVDQAIFHRARFTGIAQFDGAAFAGWARFDEARFAGDAKFDGAAFAGDAWFGHAAFADHAAFGGARFAGAARFDVATFAGDAKFDGAAFASDAKFRGARFAGTASFDGARVLRRTLLEMWPAGWTVRPNPERPAEGTLVRVGPPQETAPAALPPDRPTDNGFGTG